jgi:TP901 family phage tail tape measure protein
MAINDSTINIFIKAKNQAGAVLNDFNNQAGKSIGAGKAAAMAVQGIGIAAAGMAVKMGVDAVQAAINFETKMSEVRKTTGFSAEETKKFGQEILEMSKTLPVSTDALADIAGVAGQLGIVGSKNIKDFTEVIAKATIALPEFAGGAEEIALVVAKAQNVFKLTTKESENLLSSWNELSNTTAANAAEISRFIENVGGAAQLMNITSADASALGATLVSMGEDGSDAGTRVGSAIIFMQKHLEDAARVAGTSTAEFKKKLDENAIMAIEDVIKGLEKIPSSTDRNIAAMEIFGQIGGKVMTKLTGNLDQLNVNLTTSQNAWSANISLQKEFDVASETTAKQWVTFNNNVNAVLIELGSKILPKINDGLKYMIELLNAANVNKISESMSSIDEATKKLIKLKEEREKAGKDVENINKQIKEGMDLQKKISEDLTNHSATKKNIEDTSKAVLTLPYTATKGIYGLGKNLLGFAEGGIVPGPKGSPTLAMVHGGERINPPGRGETVININFNNSTITDETIIDKVKRALGRENELTYQGAR